MIVSAFNKSVTEDTVKYFSRMSRDLAHSTNICFTVRPAAAATPSHHEFLSSSSRLTLYQSKASVHGGCQDGGVLSTVHWRRVIIDEAHNIKNHKSQTAQTVCRLCATSRWALTGTPIHNNLLDMYALLRYLPHSTTTTTTTTTATTTTITTTSTLCHEPLGSDRHADSQQPAGYVCTAQVPTTLYYYYYYYYCYYYYYYYY